MILKIIIIKMQASTKIKDSALLGPKHMHNVKTSLQFAFNSTQMAGPPETKQIGPNDAQKLLKLSCNTSETRFNIASGAIHVSENAMSGSIPSNSPFGSWLNMYYPLGK